MFSLSHHICHCWYVHNLYRLIVELFFCLKSLS
ncbi:hypothetical protein [Tenacibaculum crassostreae]